MLLLSNRFREIVVSSHYIHYPFIQKNSCCKGDMIFKMSDKVSSLLLLYELNSVVGLRGASGFSLHVLHCTM